MTEDEFWRVIEESRRGFDAINRDGNMDRQLQWLKRHLASLSTESVQTYERIFAELLRRAYRWDLWGAAYIIGGGCSDDSFTDFRYWLISMSRDAFEAALADPDSLAAIATAPSVEVSFFEEFGYVAQQALEERGASSLPETRGEHHPREPAGQPWREEELPARFPALWARLGEE